MYKSHDTLDGLLRDVYSELLAKGSEVKAHKGTFKEVIGGCLHLTNPRARLSRSEGKGKLYSALGEFLWYLSGDTRLDFIDYYIPNTFQDESDDKVRVRSGYGDRLYAWRGVNQIENIVKLLAQSQTSRRAVIQLFDAFDITQRYRSAPCTCTLQFLGRDGHLHMFVSMRSNDAFLGLPHDVFAFTMLQELVARQVNMEVGEYKHCAGSLHLYDRNYKAAEQYLDEGWQDPVTMPPMPSGDPSPSIQWLQLIEAGIRLGTNLNPDIKGASVDPYWKDIARLLLSLKASRTQDVQALADLRAEMHSTVYNMFLMARYDKAEQAQGNGASE